MLLRIKHLVRSEGVFLPLFFFQQMVIVVSISDITDPMRSYANNCVQMMRKQDKHSSTFRRKYKHTDREVAEFVRDEVYKDLQLMITEAVYRMKSLKINMGCFKLECTDVRHDFVNPPYGLDTNYFEIEIRFNGTRKKR